MGTTLKTSFSEYVSSEKWKPLDEHLSQYPDALDSSINESVKYEDERTPLRRNYFEETRKVIYKKPSKTELEKALKILLSGDVVGIDGTCAEYLINNYGIYARIGLVAVSYKQKKAEVVARDLFDEFIRYDLGGKMAVDEELNKLRDITKTNGFLTHTHIEGIMLFKEREMALERKETWRIVHGELFPYNLRLGLGYLKALKATLGLMEKIFIDKKIVAVQGTTGDIVLSKLGSTLKDGEYVDFLPYTDDLQDFVDSAHFTDVSGDKDAFRFFNDNYGNLIHKGMFKVKNRSYIFYAHRDVFDEAATILMRDSMFMPMRGFPLLVDHADSICSRMVSASDFKRQIEYKLAKIGSLEENKDEHDLRRR